MEKTLMEIKQTFEDWQKEIEVMLIATKTQVRLQLDFIKILYLAGASSLEVFKMLEVAANDIGLIDDGRPIPYDIGLSKPKDAEVIKIAFLPGDLVRTGVKGKIEGGKLVYGREFYFVTWEIMPGKLNVVDGDFIKVLKR